MKYNHAVLLLSLLCFSVVFGARSRLPPNTLFNSSSSDNEEDNITCAAQGDYCGYNEDSYYYCLPGLYCNTSMKCSKLLENGQTCSSQYECKSDYCSTAHVCADYKYGGIGDPCDNNNPCDAHSACNNYNDECQKVLAEGAECSVVDDYCGEPYTFAPQGNGKGKCIESFSLGQGEACYSNDACQSGLYCDHYNKSSCEPIRAGSHRACSNQADCLNNEYCGCPSFYNCSVSVCNGELEPIIPEAFIEAYKVATSCVRASSCPDIFTTKNGNIVICKECEKETCHYYSVVSSRFPDKDMKECELSFQDLQLRDACSEGNRRWVPFTFVILAVFVGLLL